jgi:hypothetical protein
MALEVLVVVLVVEFIQSLQHKAAAVAEDGGRTHREKQAATATYGLNTLIIHLIREKGA